MSSASWPGLLSPSFQSGFCRPEPWQPSRMLDRESGGPLPKIHPSSPTFLSGTRKENSKHVR